MAIGIFAALAWFSALAAMGTLVYQAFLFLRYGVWVAFSATAFCAKYLGIQWCAQPADWLGLHNILTAFSPGGAVFAASLIGLAFVSLLQPSYR